MCDRSIFFTRHVCYDAGVPYLHIILSSKVPPRSNLHVLHNAEFDEAKMMLKIASNVFLSIILAPIRVR